MNRAFGLAGSDAILEKGSEGVTVTTLMPIQGLRFVLAARPDKIKPVQAKLANGEGIALGTSYPNTAIKLLGSLAIPTIVQGGAVEALPWQYSEQIDGIFELVRSGKSLDENGLEIVEDDIYDVYLQLVEKNKAAQSSR